MKALRGDPITIEDKVSVLTTIEDLQCFAAGLKKHGLETPETLETVARRRGQIAEKLRESFNEGSDR
jgi:hypothetical protein